MRDTPPLCTLFLAALTALGITSASCSDEAAGDNAPPTLVLSPDATETGVTVGDTVTITVLAKDPDGDRLTFRYMSETNNDLSTIEKAEWFTSKNQATFTWSPDSADVTVKTPLKLIFIVEDGRGGYTDRQILVNILAGNGKPRFESSSNQLYKGCCDKPITFEVLVRDDDSQSLDLRMESSPAGATFKQTGKKSGTFSWTPSGADTKKRVHNVTFEADDKENPTISQRVSIIIPPEDVGDVGVDPTKEDADLCSVEQFLTHTPPDPLRAATLPEGIPISAIVSDTLPKKYETFYVSLYEDTLPDDQKASTQENPYVVDLKRSGQMLTGTLPTVLGQRFVNADKEAVTLFYRVCMSSGSPDDSGLLCIPSAQGTYFSVNQYAKKEGRCKEELMETLGGNSNFENTATVSQSWTTFLLCQDNPDFHALSLNPGDKKRLLISYSDQKNTTLTLYDQAKNPLPQTMFKTSPCSGFSQAILEVPEAGSPTTYYLKVEGDESSYRVRATDVVTGAQVCKDSALEPNDTVTQAKPLTPGQKITAGAICPQGDEDIFSIDLTTGQRLDAVLGFSTAQENLADLLIYKPSQRDEVLTNASGHGSTFGFDTQSENAEYGVRECGTHYLRVLPNDPESVLNYTLAISLAADACIDDDAFAKDCNHSAASSTFFGWDTSYALALCAKGEDWFAHKGLNATTTTIVKPLEGSDLAQTTVTLLKRGSTAPLAQAKLDPKTGFITLDYTFPDNATYDLVVASSTQIRYSLSVTRK